MIASKENALDTKKNKSIVILDRAELQNLRIENPPWILNPEIYIVDLDNIPANFTETNIYKQLDHDGLLNGGNVLSRNPYNWESYEIIKGAQDLLKNSAIQKYIIFSTLCGMLGTKRIKIEDYTIAHKDTSIENKTKGGKGPIKVELSILNKLVEDMSKNMKLEDVFEGGVPDINAAKSFLQDNHLSTDVTFSSLIQLRALSNKFISRTLSFSLTNESMETIKVAANIQLPNFTNIGNDFNRIANNKEEVRLEVKVDF